MSTACPGDLTYVNYFCVHCVFELYVLFSTDNGFVPYEGWSLKDDLSSSRLHNAGDCTLII